MKKQTNLPATGRKLSLNKKTISNLSAAEMNKYGGGSATPYPCGTYNGNCDGGKTKNGNTCAGHNTCNSCFITCVNYTC